MKYTPPPYGADELCAMCDVKIDKVQIKLYRVDLQMVSDNVEMFDDQRGHRHTNTGAPGKKYTIQPTTPTLPQSSQSWLLSSSPVLQSCPPVLPVMAPDSNSYNTKLTNILLESRPPPPQIF